MWITCRDCHRHIWPGTVPNTWDSDGPCTSDHHAPEGTRR